MDLGKREDLVSPDLAAQLATLERQLATATPQEIPRLVGELERIKTVLLARIMSAAAGVNGRTEGQASENLDHLTISEVAVLLHMSKGRVYELIRQGELPAVRLGKKDLRVPLAALRERLAQRQENRLDKLQYTLYNPSNEGRRGDRLTAAKVAPTARAPATGVGRAPRRLGQHRGTLGAKRSRDPRADGPAHPAADAAEASKAAEETVGSPHGKDP